MNLAVRRLANVKTRLSSRHSTPYVVGWSVSKPMVHHGLRDTRYLGQRKRQFQQLWTAAAVNLKRLFKLAATHKVDLATTFGRLSGQPAGLMLA